MRNVAIAMKMRKNSLPNEKAVKILFQCRNIVKVRDSPSNLVILFGGAWGMEGDTVWNSYMQTSEQF